MTRRYLTAEVVHCPDMAYSCGRQGCPVHPSRKYFQFAISTCSASCLREQCSISSTGNLRQPEPCDRNGCEICHKIEQAKWRTTASKGGGPDDRGSTDGDLLDGFCRAIERCFASFALARSSSLMRSATYPKRGRRRNAHAVDQDPRRS